MKTGQFNALFLRLSSGNDFVYLKRLSEEIRQFLVAVRIMLFAYIATMSGEGLATPAAETVDAKQVFRSLFYRETLYHYYQGDYFTSLIHMLAFNHQNRLPESVPPLDISMQFSFGILPGIPEFQDLDQVLVDRNVPVAERNRFWFFLGKIYTQRGQWQAAETAFSQIDSPLIEKELQEERSLYRAIHLEKSEKLKKAIESLESDEKLQGLEQYDLAMLYLKNNETKKAIKLLEGILQGRRSKESPYLVDRIRTSLARLFLKNGQTDRTMEILKPISNSSPFYPEAMLLQAITYHYSDESDQSYYMWKALAERTDMNGDAMKTWLALPYIWLKSDLVGQASDGFVLILGRIRNEKRRLMRFSEKIGTSNTWLDEVALRDNSGRMGWFWSPEKFPDDLPPLIQQIFAEHDIHEALSAYRDVDRIIDNLDTWHDELPVYSEILRQRIDHYQKNRKKVMESLREINLEKVNASIKIHERQLGAVYQNQDFRALMTEDEKVQWSRIHALQEALENHPEMTYEKRSTSLAKGVFIWEQMQSLPERYWKSEKLLRQIQKIHKQNDFELESFPQIQKQVLRDFTHIAEGFTQHTEQIPALLDQAKIQKAYWKKSISDKIESEITRRIQWLDQQMADARLGIAIIEDRNHDE